MADALNTGVVDVAGLTPDTVYYYELAWKHDGSSLALDGLESADLHVRTLPAGGFRDRLDFLLLSCHDPTRALDDGVNGHAVWATLPTILANNGTVRFALLAGDQVYADSVAEDVRKAPTHADRVALYLSLYRRYWSNPHYRRVLCSLPAYLMWDDHDIDDGWGSREDSFVAEAPAAEMRQEWKDMFGAAQLAFRHMQSARNAPLLDAALDSFDTCFRVGRAAFVLPDLRSHRNVREKRIWKREQRDAVEAWILSQRPDIDVLFFVSPVVFSHGDPHFDSTTVGLWPLILQAVSWGMSKHKVFKKVFRDFGKNVGDLRDDINDAWGSDANAAEAEAILDFFFRLQNPADGTAPLKVVILSGDIHTPGYSTLFSTDPEHAHAPVIPHVVSSPVAYQPFSWVLEAVYRAMTKAIDLGTSGRFHAQISHHFCRRNATIVSVRRIGDSTFLKVKFYLEGFPEPQNMFFDITRGSHVERISWSPGGEKPVSVPTPGGKPMQPTAGTPST